MSCGVLAPKMRRVRISAPHHSTMRLLKGFLLLAILAGSSCEAKPGSAPKTLSKARATVSA